MYYKCRRKKNEDRECWGDLVEKDGIQRECVIASRDDMEVLKNRNKKKDVESICVVAGKERKIKKVKDNYECPNKIGVVYKGLVEMDEGTRKLLIRNLTLKFLGVLKEIAGPTKWCKLLKCQIKTN